MQSQAHRYDGTANPGLQGSSLRIADDSAERAHWDWRGPTLGELADRVAHQFGDLPALGGIHDLGFARDEPLTPCDVNQVCDLLGLPAEDFGLDL